ncbi:MAG: hypothetical protein ABI960_09565 [Candidatus Eisenbacteria bacterium]
MKSSPVPARVSPAVALAAVFALTLTVATVARAEGWSEVGDAGDLVASAQSTVGSGPLQQITGALASPTDVDLYCIRLLSVPPTGLPLVQLQCVVINGPNVWLFDALGNGVFLSQNCSGGSKTIVAPNYSLPAGIYYVAVSYSDFDAQSAGGAMWLSAPIGQRAPDGPGATGVLTGWAGSPNVQPINPYTINLEGMGYCEAPTPASSGSWGRVKGMYR